ncbi:MAG: pyruvate, water dikinase [Solirubrobacteraceae bacterium]|nr:pyruvate, water dikinase [Solirubrobacteraceae bacterium]
MLVFFDDERCADVEVAGGKGASLARMTALGMPVPPGFVVPADALEAALADTVAAIRDALASAEDAEDLAEVATAAQALVKAADSGGTFPAQVAEAYARLGEGDVPVAVRSSATAEDSEAASFAGQQETYLHVRGVVEIVERIRDCWCSFFTERALFYRREKGSLTDLGMAVVVQRMVQPDVSGVMFTVDPTKGRRDRMVVEAVFGLGEGVVSGQLTPDHYVLARDGRVKRTRLHAQPYAIVHDPAGGVREEQLTPERGKARTLDEDQLTRLAKVGVDLEERFGRPQDIEWAMQDDELYVLQSRPVTT